MSVLKTTPYEKSRSEFFEEKYNEAVRKMDYWTARATDNSDKAIDLAAEWGEKVSFYQDAIIAFDGDAFIGSTTFTHHRCNGCGRFALRIPRYCPGCGAKVEGG